MAFSPDSKILVLALDNNIVKLWDIRTEKLLQTDNIISITNSFSFFDNWSSFLIDNGLLPISPSSSQAPSCSSSLQSISIEEQWVLRNGERLLWLPFEYQPDKVAIHNDLVGFGYLSGRILIMKFTI
jgi:WD40 repeat protein